MKIRDQLSMTVSTLTFLFSFGSVRRVYMVNKEICKRLMCKEHEVMEGKCCLLQRVGYGLFYCLFKEEVSWALKH